MEFKTQLIHGNHTKEPSTGATNIPIYFSNAYAHDSAKELADIFSGRDFGYVYSRISNPSVDALEKRMVVLEEGRAATATASGMSAIYLTLRNILLPGDEMIASKGVFGGTYNLLKNLERQDIKVIFIDECSESNLQNSISEKTKVVFAETMGNPKLDVLDIERVAKICNEKDVIFAVDSTVTTPYLLKPLQMGADIVIHSTSKYINGTSNAIGGVIVDGGSKKFRNDKYTNFQFHCKRFPQACFTAKLKSEIGKDLGAVLSPMNALLTLSGVETLDLRMEEHCKNALELAHFLNNHSKIEGVNYPGLPTSPYYKIATKYYGNQCGGILTVRFGSKENAFHFIDSLKLFSNLANIGDTKSLVIHPSSTICAQNTQEEKEEMGVFDDLVRMSVGIEDIKDIIEDVAQALVQI